MTKIIEHGGIAYNKRLRELAHIYLNIVDRKNCGSPRSQGYVCPFCQVDDTTYEFTEALKKKEGKQNA